MKKWKHGWIGFAVTLGVVCGYLWNPGILHRLELLTQDVHFQLRGPLPAGPNVVIAAIDEKSLDELGRWPWPRRVLSELVEKLKAHGARVIGFDVIFSSPDNSSGNQNLKDILQELQARSLAVPAVSQTLKHHIQESDYDARFASILEKSPGVVLGYFFHFSAEGLDHLSEEERRQNFQNIKRSEFGGIIKSRSGIDLSSLGFWTAYAAESNIAALSRKAKRSGFISFKLDPDGRVRKLPLMVRYQDPATDQDHFFAPFALQILEKFLDGTLLFRVGESGVEKVLLNSEQPIDIPTNERGEIIINFLGKRGTFPHYSITDIIHDRKTLAPSESFRNKIVLVGATASALGDVGANPFDPAFPGVEMHATVIDNVLQNNTLIQPSWVPTADLIHLFVAGIVFTWLYSRLKPYVGLSAYIGTSLLQFGFTHWVFVNKHVWTAGVFPLLENLLIVSSIMLYRHVTEEKQKKYIQKVFSQYMSPRVVDQLLKDPNKLELGGEQKELTALFTDLEGFSTLAEKYNPREIVEILNSYFTEMMDILIQHEGTLDHYDGDAVKAFFGAPVVFDDHARRACWVCIEMQEKLRDLRQHWKQEGKPELYMRVGINTGEMIIGNIGAKNRMHYGMNGDSVNLAARLESANKAYGTFSIIGEATYQQAKDYIEVRELDSVRVVGREAPVTIYELLGKAGSMDPKIRQILPLFQEGMKFYKKKQWKPAIDFFEKARALHPADGPTRILMQRCREFEDSPPHENWDGTFVLQSK